ncbi:hypothetical protein [Mycobacteroides abscessus]|uniref:DUF1542 domain-containing protein n=2 Tax=Mycobacteroides abscessus TaxID=36809 RepID=A0A0U0ZL64_9MYCO|nr:hypothetical protein [Mycobacteroides abscessus]AGM28275.1 hypothetical protein MASS_1673 [Mycobacteroides abscessus subsp. bolletii 50594]MBE5468793.1 hypothetical protein [Mycobacteroides abscessus]MBL3733167.1 DUF1542 domain-containing protein [Mycobacteroides abscessus subsp. massiliense]MBL3747598.1 DUF1542 domain-containing protein [Mycobacteroides abscessus subsp. massiliense]MBL3760561.1 DUF1542 domain-containing protein [Mycobacteroides abscessus subsp. massiliense]
MEIILGLLLLGVIVGGAIIYTQGSTRRRGEQLEDAKAEARRLTERLGGQVLGLSGTDDASRQALADASERYTAASSAIEQARTPSQAALAKESAIEGLYYVRAARLAMGMDPGPELPSTAGQSRAGAVSEERRINFEGREIEASPQPSGRTPNYYPGGTVAGRPVPAGWYSEPWWKPALVAGAWGVGSALLFNSLFSGMHGVGYGAQGFESGFGQGYSDGYDAGLNAGQDGGADQAGWDQGSGADQGGGWDQGGSSWDQGSGWDSGGSGWDGGGWDGGGGDFGGDFGDF